MLKSLRFVTYCCFLFLSTAVGWSVVTITASTQLLIFSLVQAGVVGSAFIIDLFVVMKPTFFSVLPWDIPIRVEGIIESAFHGLIRGGSWNSCLKAEQ